MSRQLLWPFLPPRWLFSRDLGWYLSRYANCFALIAPRRFLHTHNTTPARFITVQCTKVQSAVLLLHVVCPSVCLSVTVVVHDHIGWKSWKLTARMISPTSSLFVAQRSSIYSQGNMEKFWGENISTPTSITSGWIETSSTESHVILGGGVAVCLLLSEHLSNRTVFLSTKTIIIVR